MKIAFYGGETAGMVVLLALLGLKHQIVYVIADDEKVRHCADLLGLPQQPKNYLGDTKFIEKLSASVDLFICCHGWKILSKNFVTTIKCLNFHPCLYTYKGLHPIARLISDQNPKASVAMHWMSEKIDGGKVIYEEFKMIKEISTKNEAQVYNELYPLYISVLIRGLKLV